MVPAPTPPGGSGPPEGEHTDASPDVHLGTFTHEGRFWDAHLEFVDDPGNPDTCRARLRFVPTDRADHEEPARTAIVLIEATRQDTLRAARALDRYHLVAMLRSVT